MKCAKCDEPRRASGRYCNKHHAEYMREWRKTHPLTEEQRLKSNARRYAKVYVQRGKIKKEPCKECGSPASQIHHPDYTKPLLIEWLCRPCHLQEHKNV